MQKVPHFHGPWIVAVAFITLIRLALTSALSRSFLIASATDIADANHTTVSTACNRPFA